MGTKRKPRVRMVQALTAEQRERRRRWSEAIDNGELAAAEGRAEKRRRRRKLFNDLDEARTIKATKAACRALFAELGLREEVDGQ